ncbi:MAG: ArsR/SmtB family transcription factor [Lachnospiraceae bacterium]|jgi:ArsR family transcriptional regulator
MATSYEERAKIFKALSDERRLRILDLLHGGEKCTCTLTDEVNMPQSSLSYHMKILCEAGIVTGREDGKWTHYQISKQGSEKALALLKEITAVDETNCCCNQCPNT